MSVVPGNESSVGGALDLSQFFRVFFEEAAEHLATMETLLVSGEPDTLGAEDIAAVFRAAHSIKGGAGTFGFADMAEVTHEAETLLDKVRNGEMSIDSEMIDVLLAAGDVLKAQLACHRGDAGAEPPDAEPVCERIRALLAGPVASDVPVPPAAARRWEARIARDAQGELPHALDALLAEFRLHDAIEREDGADGACVVRFVGPTDIDEARDLFAFTVAPERLTLAPAPAAAAADASAMEEGFGFFDDAPGAPELQYAVEKPAIEGFGFFDDAPGAPAAAATPQDGAATRSPGRRATDDPNLASGRAGRRENDKVVATAQAENASIRVGVEKVDQLINQVGELVITYAMLAQAATALDPVQHQRLLNGLAGLERNTRDLQESVMSIRMMPIAFVFNRFPRTVRDLAAKLGKKVQLVLEGEQTELDKGLVEKIADPLTHLVRNSVDHGIEQPADRVAAGKPETGTVVLRAAHQSGTIMIQVSDDGRGLDRARIIAKARERGMEIRDDAPDHEVWGLIFEAGFSTAAEVTDVSGRGVGMDVVRRNIHALGGTVEIESNLGQGTRITVRLPLTLAIMDGMSIAVGAETYILPLGTVVESLRLADDTLKAIAGRGLVAQVRGEYLSVLSLHELFPSGPAQGERASGVMLVVEADGAKIALLVDELLGQQQVVVKSLETNYRKVAGVSGATILGDGRVAMILDVSALIRRTRAAAF
jgi:two-component system chemotaxis sensor kinase CheA